MTEYGQFYNEDCIEGCKKHAPDDSVDLIITDPPYGIDGDKLHKHYNRKEGFVLDGYIEVPGDQYAEFSLAWIEQAARILRPGGSIYIVSGYTNLVHILNALHATCLEEVNHIIWKYNFGVHTRRKYVSSHYHILYYTKPGERATFNINCRYGANERDNAGSLNYRDREDVWIINREYKPTQRKNKNELPKQLLIKMIQYSSNEDDLVCDLFLGSFSTAKVAIGLNRRAMGFEKSKIAFEGNARRVAAIEPGSLMPTLRRAGPSNKPLNQGRLWTEAERELVRARYQELIQTHPTKKRAIELLSAEFGRGRFAMYNVLKEES
ncbi:MAG: site-specific DNA-methyltransferase [Candidatus Coatesbacteria bacterium]|nr:site-specific DNA-methyltransferase [Candidatus Coatesbacteria bacterium]